MVAMDLNESGTEVLSASDCLHLLIGGGLGHVAISDRALPAIVPVMFVIDHGDIVFRAKTGTPLDWATQGTVIAFEADRIHPGAGGWSVFVTGVAHHLEGRASHASYRLVSLSPDMVSGRRIDGLSVVELISPAEPAIRPVNRDPMVATRI